VSSPYLTAISSYTSIFPSLSLLNIVIFYEKVDPTGAKMVPPFASYSISTLGISLIAAPTCMTSYGPFKGNPLNPSHVSN